MACPLPRVLGVLSDATKIKFSNIDSQMAELLHLDISPANFTNFGAAWTEVDSGTNVSVDGNGVLTMNGAGSYATNGMYHAAGVTRAEGYFELLVSLADVALTAPAIIVINTSAALPAGIRPANTVGSSFSASNDTVSNGTNIVQSSPVVNSTWYTIRIYILKSADGTTWGGFKATISGGIYTTETILGVCNNITAEHPATLYLTVSRNANSATKLTSVKLPKWYSGYTTDGSGYARYTHDAGAGKVFNNIDFTAFAMPGTVPSTNLTFKYYFGDSATPSMSAAYTLAQLQALGKISESHRYFVIDVIAGSDGATQCYVAKPNSDTATDGAGDFPDVGNVRPPDTVQGTEGTLANLVATDAAYTTLENGRNSGAATGIIKFAETITQKGMAYVGTAIEESHTAADLDKPTANHVTENDTTGLVAGLIPLSDVMPASGGTSDKLYSAAEEVARNIDPGVANVKDGTTYKILNADKEGTYAAAAIPAPTAPTLGTPEALSSTSVRVYFTWAADAEKIYLERSADGATWGTPVETTAGTYYKDITGLTAGTTYYWRARAWNTTGYSAYSATVHCRTLYTHELPANIPGNQLLDSIRAAILEITSGGTAVFSSDNVVVGTLHDLDSRKSTGYPSAEIMPWSGGGAGQEYESQRNLRGVFTFRIVVRTWAETVARVTGTDLKTLSLYGMAVLRRMYRFIDDAQSGAPPCTGFFITAPDFAVIPHYEEFTDHVNTEIIQVSFRVDNADTEI